MFAADSDETAESCRQLWKHSLKTKLAGSILKTVREVRRSLRLGNKARVMLRYSLKVISAIRDICMAIV